MGAPRGWGGRDAVDEEKGVAEGDGDGGDEVDSYEDEDVEDMNEGEGDVRPVMTSDEYRNFLDEQLERTLEEYGDEDIGDLEDEVRGIGICTMI